jgi:hypothetical protein
MECKKCKSKWESQLNSSESITKCPFCGASLIEKETNDKEGPFDNSKEALIYIANKHGVETLLGNLKNIFPDYAPLVSKQMKGLVLAVYQHGSAKILLDNISSKQADKEIAFKKAVAKLTEAFIVKEAATAIILEFTEALGWNITPPVALEPQHEPQHLIPKPQLMSVNNKGLLDRLFQPVDSTSMSSSIIRDEILGGKWTDLKFGTLSGKPILWRVLDVRDDRALLLSEDVTHDNMQYDKEFSSLTWKWKTCKLRKWLNKDFLKTFHSQEQAQIALTINNNDVKTYWGMEYGEQTQDRIFLLSESELLKYFGYSERLAEVGDDWWFGEKFKLARVAKHNGRAVWWWLRSPGDFVYLDGTVSRRGTDINSGFNWGGVRPALWLKLKS